MAYPLLKDFDPTEHTLPGILDHYAHLRPDAVFAEYPLSRSTYSQGYRKITYHDLANAVNGVARWLIQNLGLGNGSMKLAYIGPNDMRYGVLTLASIKAGYSCKVIICPTPRPTHTVKILEGDEMYVLDVPTTQELLDTAYPPLPYSRSLGEVLSEPLLTIHTSGSTRLPRPMTFTHDTAKKGMKMHSLDAPEGYESLNKIYYGKRVFLVLPPFHGACLASLLLNALPFSTVMVAPPSAAVPSASGLVEGIKQSKAKVAIVPPSILEELVQEPDLLEYCALSLDCIIYCGGDLPQQVGDVVAVKIPLYNQYGSTELGLVSMILSNSYRKREDWKYLEFHPDMGLQFRSTMNNQYELCMVRQKLVETQQIVFTYPDFTDTNEYATGDLFERHPSPEKSRLWTWSGRRDDIIVLTNGEKMNPVGMEHCIISRSRVITGALVTGSQHFQPILLVEKKDDVGESESKDRDALLEAIWPIIQEANQTVPAYARIEKTHILFTRSEKPMKRSAKGAIQRAATVALYQQELEALHASIALDTSVEDGECILNSGQMSRPEAVADFIKNAIRDVTWWDHLDESEDLYVRGMDSQQTLSAVRILRRGFPGTGVSPAMLYTNPSVAALTRVLIDKSCNNGKGNQQSTISRRLAERYLALEMYQEMIDRIPRAGPSQRLREGHYVLITDSMTGVGPYILDTLLKHSSVKHIYCVTNVEDGRAEQLYANRCRHLNINLDPQNVTFLKVDLSQKELALTPGGYGNLRGSVTMIIHTAWANNLVWSFSSFEPHLRGLVNLLEFCTVARNRPKLFWVSSMAGPLKIHGDCATVPEQTVQMNRPSINSYGESRYVGEQILQYAHDRLGLQIAIARLTYVPGTIESPSVWSENDWLSGLIAASLQMGTLPDSLGQRCSHVDWIPMDLLSHVLVDLLIEDTPKNDMEAGQVGGITTPSLHVFHPVNLHPIDWRAVHDVIIDETQHITTRRLKSVTFQQWIQRIQNEHDAQISSPDNVHNRNLDGEAEAPDPPSWTQKLSGVHLAMRMLEFYRKVFATDAVYGLPATEKTAKSSAILRSIPAVQEEWIRKWVREWVEAFS
ncbi:NRPS-like enzyme [Aspergillus vadensis CBS 113365]|uniref:NRPS-like enzyme n=1 Tax=Aspergillus vadensis (strain CBS 113365 / IMI 142717 / IBT 24658) TaxID=1448311 RepID=A0A319BE90_ASPVC|nr:NRPS-like enzyme [Aspergillus vadensis CBS 113365]PYH70977.1 NRPS-like enzyme [Aspergillus vadensis CBS 113365]